MYIWMDEKNHRGVIVDDQRSDIWIDATGPFPVPGSIGAEDHVGYPDYE